MRSRTTDLRASGCDARQVDGQDSKILRRPPSRKSLKLPIYARWPCNKSELVRDYLEANPSATAPQAITALAKKGTKVTSSLVYSIKAKMKSGKGSGKQIGKSAASVTSKGAVSSPSGSADVVSTVRKVKSLANEVGGLKKLMALVEALSE